MNRVGSLIGAFLAAISIAASAQAESVRVKDLARFQGWRDNALVGYGIVVGLAGSGDSPRSDITRIALRNALSRLGTSVSPDQIQSRNVAAVMVTAVLPPSAHVGDRIDITVSSIGDARSLVGGTLLLTPMLAADQKVYALAQGQMVVGGYRFDSEANRQQKNYPTSGVLPGGGTVETAVSAGVIKDGKLVLVLKDADATTAERIKDTIQLNAVAAGVRVIDADTVEIAAGAGRDDPYALIARIENLEVTPDALARVVINERSGTVVAGGGVQISSVVIAQGDLKVTVSIDPQAPVLLTPSSWGQNRLQGATLTPATRLDVASLKDDAVVRLPSSTVADLVEALTRAHVDTRGVIAVLQAVKAAGALHADIIVQ